MGRDLDGANDQISFGSDASIDDFGAMTIAMWLRCDNSGTNIALVEKGAAALASGWYIILNQGSDFVQLIRVFDGAFGNWSTNAGEICDGARHHIAIVHDGTTAAPVIYVDGATPTVAELNAPSGALVADAGNTLLMGESLVGLADFDGNIQHFVYDNQAWTAAQVNRHRWHGRIGGAVKVSHPFLTDKLTNEGSATANGSATGTTVVNLVTPVQRAGLGML